MLNREIFSIRLYKLRTEKNISIVDLARKIGLKKQSVHTWENQKTVPSADKLIALADYFDVSLDYLVGRSDEPTRR